jgi:hypothetical protein
MGSASGTYGKQEKYKYIGRTEGKRRLGRPRRRWDDNVKINLQQVGLGVMNLD